MKTLLLVFVLTVSVCAQSTTHDKFTDTTVTTSKEVRIYRNSGGLLVYFPDEVSAQLFTSSKSAPTLGLRVNSFDWQFTNGCEVYFIADGERSVLPCEVRNYRAYSLMRSTYVTENLTVQAAELRKILQAKELLMRVGSYEFKVRAKDLKTLVKAL